MWMFLMAFFNSVIEKKWKKEINRLLSKKMSNVYLKITIEKKCGSQDFHFFRFKNLSPGLFWEASAHEDIIEFWKFLL